MLRVLAELSAEMHAIVEGADRLTDSRRERELRRWGITDEMAAAYRGGTMPSEVLANLRTMQGIRVARSLEPVGNDFAVRPDMFDEALHYFRSLPETEVVPGDLSMLVDPTMVLEPSGHGYLILSHGSLAVPIETGARSFVVRSAGEAPFRVYERSSRASGELAPHVEIARSAAEVAEARGPLPEGTASTRTTSGGTVGHDPVRWGMARRINAVDPSWMANRGPATNAAGFFTGDARPFGFAIDNVGGVWGIMNFIDAVTFGPGGVTIDYSRWQQVVP